MDARSPIARLTALLSILGLYVLVSPAAAQTTPENVVAASLREVEDGTRPIDVRARAVARLLADGSTPALEGLRRVLTAPESDRQIRAAVAGAALATPGLPLFDAVYGMLLDGVDPALAADVRLRFRWSRPAETAAELARRAADSEAPEAARLLALDLLGCTLSLEAIPPLLEAWAANREPYGEAAKTALFGILPIRFEDAAAARQFLAERKGQDLESILRARVAETSATGGDDVQVRWAVTFARGLLDGARLGNVLDLYLGCKVSAEIRRMGAERLRTYPYAEREKDQEAAARARAAAALFDALAAEPEPAVVVELLRSAAALAASAAADQAGRAAPLVRERLAAPSREVRLAAVAALGEMKDKESVKPLCRIFEEQPEDGELRVAVLDALEKIGDGIGPWALERLGEQSADDAVVHRLVLIVGKHADGLDSVEVLADLLHRSKSKAVRQEAALALGRIGAASGDARAIDALAISGLVDADPSVRGISASELGKAPRVDEKVIVLLRDRLGEPEKTPNVKINAAWSLLRLRGAEAVAWVAPLLGEEPFWSGGVLPYLRSDLLDAKRGPEAAAFVQALHGAGVWNRAADAAAAVLDAKDLVWDPAQRGTTGKLLVVLVNSLDQAGRHADALAQLASRESAVNADPETAARLRLARGRLTRLTNGPAKAVEILRPLTSDPATAAVAGRARLEIAHSLLALRKFDDAAKELAPLAGDRELSAEVNALLGEIQKAREAPAALRLPAQVVRDLDAAEPAARKAAIEELKRRGRETWPALLEWFDGKADAEIEAAVRTIQEITDQIFDYDPGAPAEQRQAALANLRRTLSS